MMNLNITNTTTQPGIQNRSCDCNTDMQTEGHALCVYPLFHAICQEFSIIGINLTGSLAELFDDSSNLCDLVTFVMEYLAFSDSVWHF